MAGNDDTSIQNRCREITARMDPMISAQTLCGILQEYFPLEWMNLAVADSTCQKLRYRAVSRYPQKPVLFQTPLVCVITPFNKQPAIGYFNVLEKLQ